jgi:hypothetical protein
VSKPTGKQSRGHDDGCLDISVSLAIEPSSKHNPVQTQNSVDAFPFLSEPGSEENFTRNRPFGKVCQRKADHD